MTLPSLLLVGCGKMGGALWQGWLEHGLAPSIILDRRCDAPPAPHRVVRDARDIPHDFRPDIVILAVKPAGMEDALSSLRPWLDDTILISMLAARTMESLRAACGGARTHLVRAMPNTPAAIGQGVTGLCGEGLDAEARAVCTTLLSTVGAVAWVETEEQLEALTPISGCGPAYVFLLAELLEKEALRVGLPPETARLLARGTVSGSGALLAASEESSETLRRNVTSPNGVTAKALDVLMAPDGLPALLEKAVNQAMARAREMAS
ncbi:pyrroline-5-carboxylate reductase [Swaminathania salitolerans]|uniref:Pyrroline-5-carboxylate reductase n=1 Tax=Swaminathania salitolerans TaxID=182838 RepID=A0A511BRG3_9PROT|nr:pyrroline-5-carboxylate reductase [Swaminathania salitolerans]GBQ12428.1 pyrroline-5-carboxylate reductase [Swaminathania salitolerans LMG 21291]GEL02845.1 pyrroline-5-carboxylate reductase [Swaminathania salitolerans]